jgi:hypothetical protein
MTVQTEAFLENLQMIEQSAKDFAENHIRPHVMEWDEAQHFPIETMRELGKLGFLGVLVPEEYNGSGLGYQEYISILTEIGKVCGSIGLSVAAHNSLCTGHIMAFGNEEQKKNNLNSISPVNHNSTRATRDSNFDKSTSLNENSEAKVGNLDDYNIGKQVGQGTYAIVKQAVHKPTGRLVAVKI